MCSAQVELDNMTRNSCIPHLSFNNHDDYCCELGVPCDCSQRQQLDTSRRPYTAHVSVLLSEMEWLVLALALYIFMFPSSASASFNGIRSWLIFLPNALSEHGLR